MNRIITDKEIKALEYDMLLIFDAICKRYGLYYTLCGGTLLGAIRHKGFIPWDDDIDVMMPRPDFNRFCQMIKDNAIVLPDHLSLISWFTAPSMDIPFVKIIDRRTRVTEEYMISDQCLWIDILVIDGCPEDNQKLKRLFANSKRIRWALFNKQTKPGAGTTRGKAFLKDIVRFLLKPVSAKKLCQKLDRLSNCYRFDECKSIGCIEWGYGPQERVNKSAWMKPVNVEFEGGLFPAPSNYDEYLSNLYGDYMSLPPIEKRTSHNMNVEIIE